MHHWTDSALGHYLLEWEQQRCDEAVADIFGYHALQLGLPQLQGLRSNRMPHRWLALDGSGAASDVNPDCKAGTLAQAGLARAAASETESTKLPSQTPVLMAAAEALPFSEASLDLLLMPHTLEASNDPHSALREAARETRNELARLA